MAKAEWIARQSGHPRGLVGHVVARIMAVETSGVNDRAIDALGAMPGEAVLDVGCGHGRSLARLARRVAEGAGGLVVGVDPSKVMVREARRRNRRDVLAGLVRVEQGESGELPFDTASFDAALAVHTLYFWRDLASSLREIRRVLRPGGRILLMHRPSDDVGAVAALPRSVYHLRGIAEVEDALACAGFVRARTESAGDAKSMLALCSAEAPGIGAGQ